MARMSLEEVQAILAAERADALSADQASRLSDERQRAMDFYLGDVSSVIPDIADQSKAVSNDVADTIEGIMPSMMEIFASGDEIVKFNPVSEEDEAKAEQETDYINHVFNEKNRGFLVLYSFIKDALLSKLGVVKAWWEEREDEERETYKGLTDEAYGLLLNDPEIRIVEHSEYDPTDSAPTDPAGDDAGGDDRPALGEASSAVGY